MTRRREVPAQQGEAALRSVLAAAHPGELDRRLLRTAVRWLLEELARRAPGHSVEVRVPPLAAIQAVQGPTHRRGTPSAVVEMDAHTWVALATGAVSWRDAVSSGRIRASGGRADLSPWLPLVG